MQAILISKPEILWNDLLKSCTNMLGRNVGYSLDRQGVKLDSGISFLKFLNYFNSLSVTKLDVLKFAKMLSFTFLVDVQKPNRLIEGTNLKVVFSTVENIIIVAGTVDDWYQAIIKESIYEEHRLVFDQIALILEKLGYDLWKKEFTKDKLFILKEKQ